MIDRMIPSWIQEIQQSVDSLWTTSIMKQYCRTFEIHHFKKLNKVVHRTVHTAEFPSTIQEVQDAVEQFVVDTKNSVVWMTPTTLEDIVTYFAVSEYSLLLISVSIKKGISSWDLYVVDRPSEKILQDQVSTLDTHLRELAKKKSDKARFGMLQIVKGTLEVTYVEIKPRAFIPEHYPEVCRPKIAAFMDEGISKATGRLHILSGPPGTGKTSLLTTLPLKNKDSTVISVPSLVDITGPALTKLLRDVKEESRILGAAADDQGPIILIAEDADDALRARGSGSSSLVAGLLNAVDGIFSDYINLHIVVTTNLPTDDIDRALTRPGRLGTLIHIPELSPDECQVVYKSITGEDREFTEECTLAEVYQASKAPGEPINLTPTVNKTVIGF